MWWEFHRLMDLTPEQLVDEDGPIGLLEPVEARLEVERGASRPGGTASRTRSSTSGRRRSTTRDRKAAGPDDTPCDWEVGEVVGVDAVEPDRRHQATPPRTPHPRAVVPLDMLPDAATIRRALVRARRVGGGARHRRDRARIGRPATCCSGDRRGSGRRPARPRCRRRRDRARRPRAGSRSRSDDTVLADPGAAGIRQDLHRGADDLRAARRRQAGRHHGHEPQGHRQPARAVLKAARRARQGVDVRPSRSGDDGRRSSTTTAASAGDDDRGPCARLDDGRANLAAGTAWLWASTKMRDAVDVLFVDEAGQISLAQRRRDRPAATAASCCSAIRSSSTSRCRAAIRRAPIGRRWPTSSATRPRCRPTAACSSRRPGACTRTSAHFTSEVFYDDRLEPEAHLGGQALDGAGRARGRRRAAAARAADRRRRQRIARRGGRRRRPRPRPRRGRATWIDEHGRHRARSTLERRPRSSRRTTPRSARSSGCLPTGGPGRDRRQVPGPGGADQHLLDDDLVAGARAARDGLPVQPPPAQRRDVARARASRRRRVAPTCSGSAPGRRSRCGWRTRSAGSSRWPPTSRQRGRTRRDQRRRATRPSSRSDSRPRADRPSTTYDPAGDRPDARPPAADARAAASPDALVARRGRRARQHRVTSPPSTVATIVAKRHRGRARPGAARRARRSSSARRSARRRCRGCMVRARSADRAAPRLRDRRRRRARRDRRGRRRFAPAAARRDGADRLRQRVEPAVPLRRCRPVRAGPPGVGHRRRRLGRDGRRGHRAEPRRRPAGDLARGPRPARRSPAPTSCRSCSSAPRRSSRSSLLRPDPYALADTTSRHDHPADERRRGDLARAASSARPNVPVAIVALVTGPGRDGPDHDDDAAPHDRARPRPGGGRASSSARTRSGCSRLSPISGRLTDRFGSVPVILAGLAVTRRRGGPGGGRAAGRRRPAVRRPVPARLRLEPRLRGGLARC